MRTVLDPDRTARVFEPRVDGSASFRDLPHELDVAAYIDNRPGEPRSMHAHAARSAVLHALCSQSLR